jgi:hypothetical protein
MKNTPTTMQRESGGELVVDSGVLVVALAPGELVGEEDVTVTPEGFSFFLGSAETERLPFAIVRDADGQVCGVEIVLNSFSINDEAAMALGMLGLDTHDSMWPATMSSVCQTLWRSVAERQPEGVEEVRGSFTSEDGVFIGDPWRSQLGINLVGELEAVQWVVNGALTRIGVRIKQA